MDNVDIAYQRLHNQQISQHTLKQPCDVVQWLGAMQAQDYIGAKWSIGLRLPGATEAAVEQAIANKTIVRTWPLRGTLHFVTAADIRWMLALIAPRTIAGNARRYRELELDEQTLKRGNDVLVKALQGGKELTRKELTAILDRNGISSEGQRAPHLLQRASLDGLICQGVMRSNSATFMLIDEALPQCKPLARDEALAELARRYFTSRAPATLQDFVWWSGLSTTDARAGLESVKADFVQETIDGKTYWQTQSTQPRHTPSLYLLPGFDEYLLAYRDRSAVLDPVHATKIVPGGNGMFKPTIVSNGRVVGVWTRTVKKGAVMITAQPFGSLSDSEREAFASAAQCYGDYLALPAVLPEH